MAGYNDSVKSANVITGILSNATLQGDSAYEVAVKNGFVGTEAEWLASLKGDQGDQGIQGPIGPTGPTGATGNGISSIDMGSSGWMSIHTTDGTDYSFYVKGDKGNKGDTGVGISTVLLNSDYTLTITLTDGDTYTTDPIRGAKGETGTGVSNVTLNSDYTLTITMSDGTFYTTGSIRGAKGDKGDTGSKGDKGTSISSVTKTGTSGLVDTYTITYDDNTTSTFTVTNGQNATVEVTSDTDGDYRLTFTDVNGSVETPNLYSDVTASAKQLLSNSYTLDQVPYLFRKSPDSDRAVESIVGGTVGWNQMINKSIFDVTSTVNGITMTGNRSTGEVTVSGTATADATLQIISGIVLQNTHVYFLKQPQGASASTFFVRSGASSFWNYKSIGKIEEPTGTTNLRMFVKSGQTVNFTFVPQLFDLTTMLGSTIADYIYSLETATAAAGVAKLKEWGFFTEDYYEYCEPTLRSVEGLVSKKTVGFNQWDEEWEAGTLNAQGQNVVNYSRIRSKNYIPVIEGESYYCRSLYSPASSIWIEAFDSEKNILSTVFNGTYYANVNNTVFSVPTNAKYIRFVVNDITYNHDICINLSDPTRNGQYEPYESHTYPLDSEVVLRGVLKLDSNNNLYFDGDIYPADGNGSRRYALVDLGSLSWGYDQNYSCWKTSGLASLVKKHSTQSEMINNCAENYVVDPVGTLGGQNFTDGKYVLGTSGNLFLKNGSTTTPPTGLFLYELATPTTFTAQPYHNPQIVGDTEEFVTTGIVPVGHETKYFLDLRSRIEGLPDDFSTLIAPTEISNKATRNYTKGELLILNNQLYKVTTAIANNGTITVNTNVRATTIAQEISPLVPPTTNGTYVLKATVSNGNVTYSWVAE